METTQNKRLIDLDPRTHFALALLAAIMVMAAASPATLAVLFIPILILIRWMETFGRFWRWLRWVLPMAVFFGLVTGWAFTAEAGILAGSKLLGLTCIGHLFFLSTTPEDMANALVKAGMPYAVAFVVSAGMQFVAVLARKAREVMEAQQARGIPITGGWRAVRHTPAFFTPLLVQAFQLAEELAEAMEARGFGRQGRSFYAQYRLLLKDWIAFAIGVLITGLWILSQSHWR